MKPPEHPALPVEALSRATCTHVLVRLTIRPEANLSEVMAGMHGEMLATARLYLAGTLQQWFSMVDARGVLFLFNTTSVEETQRVMAGLPFVSSGLADLEFTRLAPLQPLRTLLPAEDPGRVPGT